jgi:hypothetical protein
MAAEFSRDDFVAMLSGARNGVELAPITTEPAEPILPVTVEPTAAVTVAPIEPEFIPQEFSSEPIVAPDRYIQAETSTRTHNTFNWRRLGLVSAIGALATVTVFAGFEYGNKTNGPSQALTVHTGNGALPTKAPASPNASSSAAPSETTNPGAQDYSLDYIGFGTQNKGCRELGAYSIAATTTIANLGGHNYLVTIPETALDLYSCASKISGSVENVPTAEQTDFVKKQVTTDQAKITGYATFAKATKLPTVKPLSELQTGYLDRGYKADTVCRSLPLLDGCKNAASWALTAAKKSKIVLSAQVLILKGIQKVCGPVEIDNEKKAVAAAYAAQAAQIGVDPSYIGLVYENPTKVPAYDGGLLKKLADKGAIISNIGLSKLFPKPAITPVCKADTIVVSKG